MLTDRVPARVEPQRVDAQVTWACEELLDLNQRGIYRASLREMRARSSATDGPAMVSSRYTTDC